MSGPVRTVDIAEALRELRGDLRDGVARLDGKIEAVLAELHADIGRMDGKIDALRTQSHSDLCRLIGAIAGSFAAAVAAMAWLLLHLGSVAH